MAELSLFDSFKTAGFPPFPIAMASELSLLFAVSLCRSLALVRSVHPAACLP